MTVGKTAGVHLSAAELVAELEEEEEAEAEELLFLCAKRISLLRTSKTATTFLKKMSPRITSFPPPEVTGAVTPERQWPGPSVQIKSEGSMVKYFPPSSNPTSAGGVALHCTTVP